MVGAGWCEGAREFCGKGLCAIIASTKSRIDPAIGASWTDENNPIRGCRRAGGRQRPLGIAAMEDKIVRAAVVAILTPIYRVGVIIGDPTLADAILDRLVHNAHRLALKGESLRKAEAKRQKLDAEPAN